jgi:hypothetical protein
LEKKPRAVQGPEWTSSELKRSVNPSPYWDGEELGGILRDHTPDPLGHGASGRCEDMVRSAWRHAEAGRNDRGTCGKIWSDLYGDMQRSAEMTGPLGC